MRPKQQSCLLSRSSAVDFRYLLPPHKKMAPVARVSPGWGPPVSSIPALYKNMAAGRVKCPRNKHGECKSSSRITCAFTWLGSHLTLDPVSAAWAPCPPHQHLKGPQKHCETCEARTEMKSDAQPQGRGESTTAAMQWRHLSAQQSPRDHNSAGAGPRKSYFQPQSGAVLTPGIWRLSWETETRLRRNMKPKQPWTGKLLAGWLLPWQGAFEQSQARGLTRAVRRCGVSGFFMKQMWFHGHPSTRLVFPLPTGEM